MTSEFSNRAFAAPADRARQVADLALQYIRPSADCRILEVGCGCGEVLVELAHRLPRASLAGVDISEPNIAAARDTVRNHSLDDRIELHAMDLLDWEAEPADLVISYSVLHLIPADDHVLFGKVAQQVAPGGIWLNDMPYRCAYNRLLHATRAVLRTCRGRLTDGLVTGMARLLAGKSYDREFYQQRLVYMYLLPLRYADNRLHSELAGTFGLELVESLPQHHASIAQPKHRMYVYRKKKP